MKHLARPVTALLTAAVFAACDGSPTPPDLNAPEFAKAGGTATVTDPTTTFYLPAASGELGLWGDGEYTSDNPFAGTSRYKEKECGVHSKLFYTGSGDAIMNSTGDSKSGRTCPSYPRRINVDFTKPLTDGLAPGAIETVEAFINTLDVQDNSSADGTGPISGTAERPLNLSLTNSKTCDGLRFRPTLPAYGDKPTGVDYAQVTRINATTWRVQTKADVVDSNGTVVTYNAKAACLKNDVIVGIYHMPVDFYIVSDRALP
jgi:hypothetical protein